MSGMIGEDNIDRLRRFCEGRLFIGHLTPVENQIVLSTGLWTGVMNNESHVFLEIVEEENRIEIAEANQNLLLKIPSNLISEFVSLMADTWGKSLGRIVVKDIGNFIGAADLLSPRIVIRGQFTLAKIIEEIDQIKWDDKDLDLLSWIEDYDERSMDPQQKSAYDLIMDESYSFAEDFRPIIKPLKVKGRATLVIHCAFVKRSGFTRNNLRELNSNEIQILESSLHHAFKRIYGIGLTVQIIQHSKKLPESKERLIRVGCHMFGTNAGWRDRLGPDTVIGIISCVDNDWIHHINTEMILARV